MEINWEPLRAIIDANERFVLTSHVRPDADAIGSELGLAGLLEARGKSVVIINPSEIPPNLAFLNPDGRIRKFDSRTNVAELLEADVHVILDTSAWGQLQELGEIFRRTQAVKIVIDHHVSADDLGAIEFKDPQAEATAALVIRMADALGCRITAEIAMPLFCALATDTGWFRYSSTTGETMRMAGRLIDLGVQPHLLYEWLYEQYSLARVKLAGRVLSRVTLDCAGRLAYTWVQHEDFDESGARPVDTEDLVNECLKIAGADVAFIAIEQQNRNVKVSFRSRSDVNVAAIAEQFGGGGHKQAAGAMLPGPLPAARQRVLAAVAAALGGCP